MDFWLLPALDEYASARAARTAAPTATPTAAPTTARQGAPHPAYATFEEVTTMTVGIEYWMMTGDGYVVERAGGRPVRVAGPLHPTDYRDELGDVTATSDEMVAWLDEADPDDAREDAEWWRENDERTYWRDD